MGKFDVKINETDISKVEAILKKLHIRYRTYFTHKSRKLYDVISDIAKKWDKYTDEERELIYDTFGFSDVGGSKDSKNITQEENKN